MFIGEYRHSLDSKNRLIIPAQIRDGLGDTFVVTKGNDGCLRIYTAIQWQKQAEILSKLPQTNKAARAYTRFITSGAIEVTPDSQGRIQLTTPLKEHATLEKSCVIIGANEFVEIWDETKWKLMNGETAENIDDITEELTEFMR